jgi:hypothetical protein
MKPLIKRKDGSYSQRGLWDSIRENKGSGKKPTAEMLKQEKKIKSKMQEGGETPMSRKKKREAFKEKVSSGDYDIYRKTSNPQVEKLSQRKTAENILNQPRSETGMGRYGKVKEAAKATGWSKGEVRREVPTAFREKITNPLMSLVKKPSSGVGSGILKFPGLQGPSGCKGGGCLDMGTESTMKKGGMFKSKSKMKHGGSHSRLKQAYLNKK